MTTDTAVDEARRPERQARGRATDLIRRQMGRARREFALGLAGTSIYAIATIVSAFVIGWVTDSVLLPAVERGDVSTAALAGAAAAILGVSVVRGFGISVRRYGAYKAQFRLQQRDRTDVTDRYLDLPIEWHRRHATGQLLSNVNADVEAASFIAAPLPMAFGVVVMLAVTTVLLLLTDPYLALVGFGIGPAIAATNIFYQGRMRTAAANAQRLRAEVSEIAHESFDAALVVKTLGRENAEVHRFGAISNDLRDSMVEVGKLRAVFDPIMEALPTIGVLGVVAVGAWRVDQGLITPGTLVTFAYLFRLVAVPMRVFAWMLGQLPTAIVGWDRVEAVLQDPGNVSYGLDRLSQTGGAHADAKAVAYLYPETEASDLGDDRAEGVTPSTNNGDRRGIESVTLDVKPGKTVALVGPTGSGKTTVAQLLIRLFDPDAGVIRLDGTAVPDLERTELAEISALVFQEAFLFDETIADNITLGGDYSQAEISEAARLAQADGFIREFGDGYDMRVGERGASLSGGQRQRIALARALIRKPRLLVMDDATSAIDSAVEAQILEGLATLDTTVVIVAYRRSSIILADEVIFLDDGRIIGRGSHAQLYRTLPAYADLIDAYEGEERS